MLFHMMDLLDAEVDKEIAKERGVWPDFKAPPQYENPAEGWTDPGLPDFRLLWKIARECGYTIGLHGSMKRDCDLIAVPWTEDACSPRGLLNRICDGINAKYRDGSLEGKPHGRMALTLLIDGWFKPIDLSIMPRVEATGSFQAAESLAPSTNNSNPIEPVTEATGGDL